MRSLKLRILNRFGASEKLNSPDEIEVIFPYGQSDSLIKRMSNGHIKILNDNSGELEVSLSDFEIQNIPIGEKQNFVARIKTKTKTKEAIFQRALNVRTMDIDGEERRVIFR